MGGYIKAQYLPLSPHFNEKQDSRALTEPAICVCLFFLVCMCVCVAVVFLCICCVKWHRDARQHIYGGLVFDLMAIRLPPSHMAGLLILRGRLIVIVKMNS